MKNKIEEYINTVITGFQNNKGKSSVYCFSKQIIPELVFNVINNFNTKHPLEPIFIVVDCYNTRVKILEYIKSKINNYEESLSIRILSKDYIKDAYKYNYKLIITIGVNDDINTLLHLNRDSKFTLCILTKNIMDSQFIISLRNHLPNITVNDTSNYVEEQRIYSPVEETRISVKLLDDDLEQYKKCTDFINVSISIFGDLSNIEKCKNGDITNNISATQFRHQLAIKNGWSETLDTNIEFLKQIDDYYNPNILFERASTFYTITKQRRDLVSDNKNKLNIIKDICDKNKDKKILIVSKRGEFAKEVTNYLTNKCDIKCGDYHDCIESRFAVDANNGLMFVKSGINKGKPRIVSHQAISTSNEKLYNAGELNVLSIKNSSNKKLNIECDIIIFTTPFCDNIFDFKKRFNNIRIINNPNKIFRLYSANTIENDMIYKEPLNNLISIIDENKKNINYDENSGDIIL